MAVDDWLVVISTYRWLLAWRSLHNDFSLSIAMNILLFTTAALAGSGRSVHLIVPGTSSHGRRPLFDVSKCVLVRYRKPSRKITWFDVESMQSRHLRLTFSTIKLLCWLTKLTFINIIYESQNIRLTNQLLVERFPPELFIRRLGFQKGRIKTLQIVSTAWAFEY